MQSGEAIYHSMWRRPSAWLPVVLSVAAMAVVLVAIAYSNGIPHEGDEGAAAHLWQLLMVCDALSIGYFLMKWVALAPRKAWPIFAVQIAAALAAMAPVYFMHL